MTIPIYKIEVWEPGAGSALHTITADALNIHTKEVITDDVGIFSFTLPTKHDGGYTYTDIDLFDWTKIWFGYQDSGGLATDPTFIGRISQISAPFNSETGYVRTFTGKSIGEILKRRLKRQKRWTAIDAHDIVDELANDLGLGLGEIQADATDVTLQVDCETYFDVLRKVSDYWYDAANQVKKDFYVNIDNELVWHTRPLRTAGVETLELGKNILGYNLTRPLDPVKNTFYVYGEQRKEPTDGDLWTETGGSWTSDGTLSWQADAKIGSNSKQSTIPTVTNMYIWQGFGTLNCTGRFKDDFDTLHMWVKIVDNPNPAGELSICVELSANSVIHKYYYYINSASRPTMTQDDVWYEFNLPLGPDSGLWNDMGAPSWSNITNIRWYCLGANNGTITIRIDALYFYGRHYLATVSDAGSIASYGARQMEYLDTNLKSDSDCTKRGNTFLYQCINPVKRLDISCLGHTNILIGDKLNMNLPAEGITTVNTDWYVVNVEHRRTDEGFLTGAVLVDTTDARTPAPVNMRDGVQQKFNAQKEIARGIQVVK